MADRDEAVLWSQDMFDRDTPPRCEGRVHGLTEGLATLWDNHLREGVQDDGRQTLTAFHLAWRGESISIPDDRAGAKKMRQWHLAPGEFAAELAAAHARAGGSRAGAEQLLALAAAAATAGELLARARSVWPGKSGPAAAGGNADELLRAAATRQQRLQWLGVGAWVVMAILLVLALPVVPAELPQLAKTLYGGIVLMLLFAGATLCETLVRRRRENAALAALARPERIVQAAYSVGRVRRREIHRIMLTLDDGIRAKFVLTAEGAVAVMRELKRRCPTAVAAGSAGPGG